MIPRGWTFAQIGAVTKDSAWHWMQTNYPSLTAHLVPFCEKAAKRCDKGDLWWELRSCDYYDAFEKPKILYPVIAKESRFTMDEMGLYSNDKTFIIPKNWHEPHLPEHCPGFLDFCCFPVVFGIGVSRTMAQKNIHILIVCLYVVLERNSQQQIPISTSVLGIATVT